MKDILKWLKEIPNFVKGIIGFIIFIVTALIPKFRPKQRRDGGRKGLAKKE